MLVLTSVEIAAMKAKPLRCLATLIAGEDWTVRVLLEGDEAIRLMSSSSPLAQMLRVEDQFVTLEGARMARRSDSLPLHGGGLYRLIREMQTIHLNGLV